MCYKQEWAQAFAARVTAMGFKVYIANSEASFTETYGFITDDTLARVLSWSADNCGSLSGNYGPPSVTSGTGWRLGVHPDELLTAEDVRRALYAHAPAWAERGWRYYLTVEQYLATYESSNFQEFKG